MRKLCSIDHLHTIIEQECARVDRNGHEFSLVVFEVAKKITNHTIEQRLVKVLTPRVRFTDTVGLLDGHRLGVVLPYTSATGAKRLANDVRQSISISALPIHCEVYTYPSHWLPRDKGNSRRNWYSDVLKKQDKAILRGLSPSTGGVSPDRQSTEYQTKTGMSSARGLDPLPVRRIPIWKRTLDIIGALLGFIVFSPLLLLIVLIIKFVSSGPILFKQIRVGYLGRMFNLLKFRTMKVSADVELHQQRLNELINSEQPMTKLDI